MTGAEFEIKLCKDFRRRGAWALNIPKNKFGAQPFDVLAIWQGEIWAVDCKVCSAYRLPLSRIEDNQWLALEDIEQRTVATCGFMILFDGEVWFVSLDTAKRIRDSGRQSLNIRDDSDFFFTIMDDEGS